MNTRSHVYSRSANAMPIPVQAEGDRRQSRASCARCGAKLDPNVSFCSRCGAQRSDYTGGIIAWQKARPAALRRVIAELLDCLMPFTLAVAVSVLIVFLDLRYRFWTAGLIVFVWDAMRDCSPNRRSLGKRLCGLRLVMDREQARYSWLRAAARRIIPTSFKLAYLLAVTWAVAQALHQPTLLEVIRLPWPTFAQSRFFEVVLVLIPLAYFAISLALMKFRTDGKRIEDFFLDTRVIRETAYEQAWKKCVACEQPISKPAVFCPLCGTRNSPSRIPVD